MNQPFSKDLSPRESPFPINEPTLSQHQPARKPTPDISLSLPVPGSTISEHSSVEGLIERLAARRQDRESLPRPEPEVFRGNLLRYPTWKKSLRLSSKGKRQIPQNVSTILVDTLQAKPRKRSLVFCL